MGVRRGLLLGLVLASGCKQLLGIDDPSVGETVDAPPPVTVTGRYAVHDVPNEAFTGVPKPRATVLRRADLAIDVVLEDGTHPTVSVADDGTFSFERPTAATRYHVMTALPNITFLAGGVDIVEHDAADLRLALEVPGRSDTVLPTRATTLHVAAGTATGAAMVSSTGVWTQTFTGASNGAGFDFDWRIAGGPGGLLRGDLGDRVFVSYFEPTTGAQPYTVMTQSATYTVNLADGATVSVSQPVQRLTLDQCLRVQARRATAYQRLLAAQPGTTGAATYSISAVPTGEPGDVFPHILVYDASQNSDSNVTVQFANPFPGTEVLATIGATSTRSLTFPTGPVQLLSGGFVLQTTTTGASCPTVGLDDTIEHVGTVMLGDTVLATDDAAVPLPSVPQVTWSGGSAGVVDYHIVTLYEVTPGFDQTLRPLHLVRSPFASATLDPAWFTGNKLYVIAVDSIVGAPNAANGDLQALQYPYGYSRSWSATFRIAP